MKNGRLDISVVWAESCRSPVQNLVRIGRTVGSGVIHVLANFNMAAGGHLGLRISTLWNHRLVPGAKRMIRTKFGAHRKNRFEVIQFLVNFSFLSAAILDFEK